MNRRRRPRSVLVALSAVALGATALVGCGSSDKQELRLSGGAKNFTMDPKFETFCAAYDSLTLSLNDMAASGASKEAFDKILKDSKALVDASPDDIVDSVVTNDAILNAMNKAFADRKYDQEKIDTDETLRQEVQALYAQDGLAELTTKYADYLVKNCGVSTAK